MNIKQLNEYQISDFLEKEGVFPVRKRGREWWYISPVRAREKHPSFKVDIRLNRWYDHGIGVGGKLFDLALRLHQNHGIREVVTLLDGFFSLHKQKAISSTAKNSFMNRQESLFTENSGEAAVKIHFTQPLGNNPAITDYLQSRGISLDIAVPYCKEVYFTIRDKNYFALGFQNRSGGYELRNAFLKISSSPKDITHLNNQSKSICVLEGFIDFLSLLMINKPAVKATDFLILNSNSNLSRSFEVLKEYKNTELFLDNDEGGLKAKNTITHAGISATDHSSLYRFHKDLNDYLFYGYSYQKEQNMKLRQKRGRSI